MSIRSTVNPLSLMVTSMSISANRTLVPVLAGRQIVSAYIFGDEPDAHGVVLTLDDDSDISIEFDCKVHLISKVLTCKGAAGDAVLLQTVA